MSEHTCTIGLIYDSDYCRLSTLPSLKSHIEERNRFNSFAEYVDYPVRMKTFTLKDYCDRRKSTNLVRFEFCPYCGKKIDWKSIRKTEVNNP